MEIKCYDFTENDVWEMNLVQILDAAFDKKWHLLVWVGEKDDYYPHKLRVRLVDNVGRIPEGWGYLKMLQDSMGYFWHVITYVERD